jgi:hypothetical protein
MKMLDAVKQAVKSAKVRYSVWASGLIGGSVAGEAGATGTISVTAITALIASGTTALTTVLVAFLVYRYLPKIYRVIGRG